MRQQEVLDYILSLDHYPTWYEVIVHFGLNRSDETDTALHQLRDENSIILVDGYILVTAVTNPKLRKLVDEGVRVR